MLVLKSDEHSLSFLRYQTSNDFLCNILSRVVQEFFKLETCEFVDDFIFSSYRYRVLLLKLVQFIILLKHIFDESSPTICHLI